MYTRRDDAIRGVLIPVLVIGVPAGILTLGLTLGIDPEVLGLTLLALLVGLVGWRIYVARHPDGWPLPKKVLRSLRAQGFQGYTSTSVGDPGLGADNVDSERDGFSLDYSNHAGVRATMNERTRALSLFYERKGPSWLRREAAFSLDISRKGDGEPLVVAGKPSELRYDVKTPDEKRLAAWIGGALGAQIVALSVSGISVWTSRSSRPGSDDPRLTLELTIPEGTFAEVSQVIAGAKELFWKLMGAVEAERTETWLA